MCTELLWPLAQCYVLNFRYRERYIVVICPAYPICCVRVYFFDSEKQFYGLNLTIDNKRIPILALQAEFNFSLHFWYQWPKDKGVLWDKLKCIFLKMIDSSAQPLLSNQWVIIKVTNLSADSYFVLMLLFHYIYVFKLYHLNN